jgi:hypothetical protein
MAYRCVFVLAICLSASGIAHSTAGQLPSYPASRPGDPGYIAEDPALARLVGLPGPGVARRAIDGGPIDNVGNNGPHPL